MESKIEPNRKLTVLLWIAVALLTMHSLYRDYSSITMLTLAGQFIIIGRYLSGMFPTDSGRIKTLTIAGVVVVLYLAAGGLILNPDFSASRVDIDNSAKGPRYEVELTNVFDIPIEITDIKQTGWDQYQIQEVIITDSDNNKLDMDYSHQKNLRLNPSDKYRLELICKFNQISGSYKSGNLFILYKTFGLPFVTSVGL